MIRESLNIKILNIKIQIQVSLNVTEYTNSNTKSLNIQAHLALRMLASIRTGIEPMIIRL